MSTPPFPVVVRKSSRRTKSASWAFKDGSLVITVPAKWTKAQVALTQTECVRRAVLAQEQASLRSSDEGLALRAQNLRNQFMPQVPDGAIVWSDKPLKSRWGFCAADGTITISRQLQGVPDFVLDAVLVHELAHRLDVGHTPGFWELVRKYDRYDEADLFLKGASWSAGWDDTDW